MYTWLLAANKGQERPTTALPRSPRRARSADALVQMSDLQPHSADTSISDG